MEIDVAKQFQERLDEILEGTEAFVNASKQLEEIKDDMTKYIDSAAHLIRIMADTSKEYGEIMNNTKRVFNGEFEDSVQGLFSGLQNSVIEFQAQVEKLKTLCLKTGEGASKSNIESDSVISSSSEIKEIKTDIVELKNQIKEMRNEQFNTLTAINRIIAVFEEDPFGTGK